MTVARFWQCLRVVVSAIAFEFAHSILYRMHSREVGSRGRPFGSTAFSLRGSVRISEEDIAIDPYRKSSLLNGFL